MLIILDNPIKSSLELSDYIHDTITIDVGKPTAIGTIVFRDMRV